MIPIIAIAKDIGIERTQIPAKPKPHRISLLVSKKRIRKNKIVATSISNKIHNTVKRK